jgi:hypothetical protein
MSFKKFSWKKYEKLQESEKNNFTKDKQIEYICKYFIPLTNCSHAMLIDTNEYNIITRQEMEYVYLPRFDEKVKTFYKKKFKEVRTPVYKLNKPVKYDNCLNLCPQLRPSQPYKTFPKEVQEKVNLFLDYIKEILAKGVEEVYTYIINWLAYMCQGYKNDSALVLKTSAKGVGKSTLPEMFRQYVLGNKLCLQSSSEPLKSKFNQILGGKLLVYFEELETFGASEWISVSSVLKRQITSSVITLEKKGQEAYQTDNINNYMLITNHDIGDEERRYFVMDISTERIGDKEYWNRLYDNCFNEEVGYALFCYLKEIDVKHFKSQTFPITKAKLESISKRLISEYDFLKQEFIKQNRGILEENNKTGIKLTDLYEMYEVYCKEKNKRVSKKEDFTRALREIKLEPKKGTNGYLRYSYTHSELCDIAKRFHWINELDEYELPVDEKLPITITNSNTNTTTHTNKKEEIKEDEDFLDKELMELEKQIDLNKMTNACKNSVKKTILNAELIPVIKNSGITNLIKKK